MSQQRQFQMVLGGSNVGGVGGGGQQHQQFIDTTYTKIFVGGLAWETQRDTMRRYFEQFGEIQEAVVITDKNTGRSKGYGFVTFKDPESASRACQDPSPVIDGRRANCNLASLGAQRNHPTFHQHGGMGRFRPGPGSVPQPTFQGSSAAAYFHQPTQYTTFPYSAAYGYSGYSQENMYPLSYYNVYGGQQVSAYYTTPAAVSGAPAGIYPSYYPFYAQYAAQSNQTQSVRIQYPSMVQYPYLPQHYAAPTTILSIPASVSPATVASGVIGSISIEGSAPTGSITIKDPGGITKQSSSA